MDKKTVFIIGAGASAEFHLPTGFKLKKIISNQLNIRFDMFGTVQERGDKIIFNALRMHCDESKENVHTYISEARHISDALPLAISIDHFIDAHRENNKIAYCSKLAIVRAILEAEKGSLLFFNKSNSKFPFQSLEDSWLFPFFQLITENCNKDDLKERFQQIQLIIFNYDRCIEHFLFHALQKYYKLTSNEAASLIEEIQLFHPYGSVGYLPWSGNQSKVEFGYTPQPSKLLEISSMIKTFTEGIDTKSSKIVDIRNQIKNSQRIVFLGFAFHPLNLKLIKPIFEDIKEMNSKNCFATAYKISESDKKNIIFQLSQIINLNEFMYEELLEQVVDKTCYEFFFEFRRSLSFT